MGVSSKTISKWECAVSITNKASIEPLCNALGITINELLNGGPSNSVLTETESKTLFNISTNAEITKNAVNETKKFLNLLMKVLTFIFSILAFVISYATLNIVSNNFELLNSVNTDEIGYLCVTIIIVISVAIIIFKVITEWIVKFSKR